MSYFDGVILLLSQNAFKVSFHLWISFLPLGPDRNIFRDTSLLCGEVIHFFI